MRPVDDSKASCESPPAPVTVSDRSVTLQHPVSAPQADSDFTVTSLDLEWGDAASEITLCASHSHSDPKEDSHESPLRPTSFTVVPRSHDGSTVTYSGAILDPVIAQCTTTVPSNDPEDAPDLPASPVFAAQQPIKTMLPSMPSSERPLSPEEVLSEPLNSECRCGLLVRSFPEPCSRAEFSLCASDGTTEEKGNSCVLFREEEEEEVAAPVLSIGMSLKPVLRPHGNSFAEFLREREAPEVSLDE